MTEPTLRDWPLHTVEFTLPMRYLLQGTGAGTVIMLHGYQDHALSMMRRMGWFGADLPFQILAINAPFPVPIWTEVGFIEAYSWYFRDTTRDIMIVHPSTTAERIAGLVTQLVPADTPLAIFGFSQGGYLAPYVTKFLPNTKAIITAGSGFPPDPYGEISTSVGVYALHGEKDDRWPLAASQMAHQKLLAGGFKGEFHVIPGLDHRVGIMLDPLVRRFVRESFEGAL